MVMRQMSETSLTNCVNSAFRACVRERVPNCLELVSVSCSVLNVCLFFRFLFNGDILILYTITEGKKPLYVYILYDTRARM